MDYNIQAFVSIPSMVNNAVGSTSPLGELSSKSSAFAREKQYYDIPDDYDAVSLVVYNCSNASSDGSVSQQLQMTKAIAEPALYLSQEIFDNYDQTTSIEDFVAATLTGTFTVESSSSVLVEKTKSMPKYIKFSFVDTNDTYNYQLWFSDAEFKNGANPYLGFEIVVIPPAVSMDTSMYNSYVYALAAYEAKQKNRKLQTSEINAIIGAYPASSIETFELKWNDPSDLSKVIQTEWTMVCYGNAASSPTNMLSAVRDWVGGNSSHTVEDWLEYFPDIETSDFFMFVPLWNQTSKVSSGTLLYSPVFKLNSAVTQVAKLFPTNTTEEVRGLVEAVPAKYRQLVMAVLPGATNISSRISFVDVFNDYSVLQVNTPQASAYSDITLPAIEAIESLLLLAEEYNTLSYTLPSGTTVVDNPANVPFRTLERSVGSFVFKVVTKESYLIVNP